MASENDNGPSLIRWWVLLILCIVTYSFSYCYDNPDSIQDELTDDYNLNQVQFDLLYGIDGYINVITPLIAGLLIDFIGVNLSTLLFYVLIFIGHSLWFVGCFESIQSYPIMVAGRAIFGVGAEQFHTSRRFLLFEYFGDAEYYLASGLTLSSSQLASASQLYISSILDSKYGAVAVVSVGWILVIFSLCLLILSFFILKRHKEKPKTFSKVPRSSVIENEPVPSSKSKCKCKCYGDIRVVLLGINLLLFYSAYLSYSNAGSDGSTFSQNSFQINYDGDNQFAPIIFWISAAFTPIFGFLSDFFGKRTAPMLLSGICLLFGYGLLGFVGSSVFASMLLGFGYFLGEAAIWPLFGLIVKQKYLAMTLGMWGSIDNAFQVLMSLCVAELTKVYEENDDQYDSVRYLWIGLSVGMILFTLLLWRVDATKYEDGIDGRSEKFEGMKLSDLLHKQKRKENDGREMKKIDDKDGDDGRTNVAVVEDEDELLVQ